jgi:hypothetical protein
MLRMSPSTPNRTIATRTEILPLEADPTSSARGLTPASQAALDAARATQRAYKADWTRKQDRLYATQPLRT